MTKLTDNLQISMKVEHKLKDLFDKATEYAKMKGYTTLRTGMSSMDFNIDGCRITDIPEAIRFLKTDRIDYKWLLDYGFQVIGIRISLIPKCKIKNYPIKGRMPGGNPPGRL